MQDVSASKKPEKEIAKGQAGNIKARFEKMGAQDSEVGTSLVGGCKPLREEDMLDLSSEQIKIYICIGDVENGHFRI